MKYLCKCEGIISTLVHKFYLRTAITDDGKFMAEIKWRIWMEKSDFYKMNG